MKARPISCEETSARRWRVRSSLSPSMVGDFSQMRSATNSRMASATFVDAAIPATQAANEEPVPSAWSHMERKPVITKVPDARRTSSRSSSCMATVRGSKGRAMAATKRLAFPSK